MCNCERAQDLISAYVDGEITAEEKAELNEHVAQCASCADMLAVYSEISRAMAEDVEPPASLREGVMGGVREINAKRKPKKAKIVWLRWAATAAALAIVSFVGVMAVMPRGSSGTPLMKAADTNESAYDQVYDAPAEAYNKITMDTATEEPAEEAPAEPEDSGLEASLFLFPAAPDEDPAASNSVNMEQAMNDLIDAAERKADWKAYIVHCSVDDNAEVVELCKSLGAEIVYEYDTIGGCAVRIAPESAEDFLAEIEAIELVLAVNEDSSFELN